MLSSVFKRKTIAIPGHKKTVKLDKEAKVMLDYNKVEKINSELDKKCIQGIPLGSVKIKIPNVLEYEKHLSSVVFKSIAEVSVKDIKNFSKKTNITDSSVWCADVSGYSQITVNAEGFERIYVTIIG